MPLRARHQKKAIDGVVLHAARGEDARDAPLPRGRARLFKSGLRRGMRFREPADQLRLAIGSRPALFEIGKVLREVSKQIRVACAGLAQGRSHNVRRALREREFRALEVGHELGEAGSRGLVPPPDGALDLAPAERAIRDDAGSRCLGQIHRHLEIRYELEHIHLPAAFPAFQRAFLQDGQGIILPHPHAGAHDRLDLLLTEVRLELAELPAHRVRRHQHDAAPVVLLYRLLQAGVNLRVEPRIQSITVTLKVVVQSNLNKDIQTDII